MNIIIFYVAYFTLALILGTVIGYYTRQSIAKKRAGTIEAKLEKKLSQVKEETNALIKKSQKKAAEIIEKAQKEIDERRREFLKAQQVLLNREKLLNEKIVSVEEKEKELLNTRERLKTIKENLEQERKEIVEKLEKIAHFTREDAKKELLQMAEAESEKEILERIKKLEEKGKDRLEQKAKEIIALAIQKCAVSQAQELTTTTVVLENEELKGRIIGKEGRNIRTFEKLTGVELIIDETPDSVIISAFNPVRRQIAKLALEKLIQDGRIQPAKIEEKVNEAKTEIAQKIKEAGEMAVYETKVLGLNEKLIQLLGRLYYRTSYGQNVLLHSIETALIAQSLAEELKANVQVAKRAALLHDIGKAIDQEIQGSHVEIGIKLLERFGESEEVIKAMRAHHDDYPIETLEAVIVKVADAISGSRIGARKDTLENYLQRLKELEDIATKVEGVETAYVIQAGREIRAFVKPEVVDDFQAQKIAKQIAERIEDELKYPGEIKVTVIREYRVIEYAR